MIDLTTPFGVRVAERLKTETLIWITTTRADGVPLPSLVWFLWDGETILIYSRADKPKLRNIESRPQVALNFNSNQAGGDVGVFIGAAAIDTAAPPSHLNEAYQAKYRDAIARIGLTAEQFAAAYSVAVRVTPARLWGQ
jgi:PPOX class probable F420-dependent enzyme